MTSPSPVDDVLAALADPVRRRLLDLISEHGEASATVLAASVEITRQGVMKHLAVLERAALVESHRQGREVRYRIRPARLHETAHWFAGVADRWGQRLDTIKRLAEGG